MDKIATQLEILRRVLAEIQDSSQDDLAQEVVPIVKKVDELDLGTLPSFSFSLLVLPHIRNSGLKTFVPLPRTESPILCSVLHLFGYKSSILTS